jgi:hypothetical protein
MHMNNGIDNKSGNVTYRVLFGCGDFLNSEGIVKQTVAREVLTHIFLNKLDTKIRIIDTLDLVANARD